MNNMKNKYLPVIGLLAVVSFMMSCNHLPFSSDGKIIDVDLTHIDPDFPMSTCVDTIQSAQLKLPKPYCFGVVTEVLLTDSSYYLVDEKQDMVF